MLKNILGDLKSTFAGAGLAALHVIATGVNWKSLLTAAAIAALGALTQSK